MIKAELSIRSRKLSDLWATRAMQRRTLVAVGVQVFTQFTGINGTRMIAQFQLQFIYHSTSYQLLWTSDVHIARYRRGKGSSCTRVSHAAC